MSKKVTKSEVEEALSSFEDVLSKASDHDLDQPEGGDMDAPENMKNKMSDAAPKGKAEKSFKAPPAAADSEEHEEEEHGEDMEGEMKSRRAKKSYMGDDHVDESEEHGEHKKSVKKMKESEMAKKSFYDEMPEEIQTKIDVSEFLKSLVGHTGDCIDELAERVVKSEARISKSHGDVMSAVEDLQKSQAKIGIVLKAICERIGIIENAPARTTKSETTVAKSGAGAERTFASGLEQEAGAEPIFKGLSQQPHVAKSQMSAALCEMVRKGEAQDLDVIGFETSGFVRPELMPKLKAIFQ